MPTAEENSTPSSVLVTKYRYHNRRRDIFGSLFGYPMPKVPRYLVSKRFQGIFILFYCPRNASLRPVGLVMMHKFAAVASFRFLSPFAPTSHLPVKTAKLAEHLFQALVSEFYWLSVLDMVFCRWQESMWFCLSPNSTPWATEQLVRSCLCISRLSRTPAIYWLREFSLMLRSLVDS